MDKLLFEQDKGGVCGTKSKPFSAALPLQNTSSTLSHFGWRGGIWYIFPPSPFLITKDMSYYKSVHQVIIT